MRTYIIESEHDIYIDSYEDGEGEQVSSYTLKSEVRAETPKEAIEKYFDAVLCLSFDFEKAAIAHKEDENEPKNKLWYSSLVDDDNVEASPKEIIEWQEGKMMLYTNNITLYIHQLTEVELYFRNYENSRKT